MTAVEITVPLEHLPGVTDSGTRRLLKHAAFEAPWTCGSAEGETFARLASIDLAVEVRGGTYVLRGEAFTRVLLSALGLEGPLVIKLPNGRSVYGAEIEAREGVLEVQRDEAWQERLRYIDEKNAELREHMRFVNHALLNAWRVGVPVGTRVALRERTDGPEVLITRTCSTAWPTATVRPWSSSRARTAAGVSRASGRSPMETRCGARRCPRRAPHVDPPPVGTAPEGSST